ncbi:undecaprenyl-diphosphate phosphatase [bacterium]|nr:undecaprenyl-diphosphate phosphatase [bacterium]
MNSLILLAVIQIIAEVLPISSSGHLRLAELLAAQVGLPLPVQPHYFDEFLHLYTFLVVALFFRAVWLAWPRRLLAIALRWGRGARLTCMQVRLLRLCLRLTGNAALTMVITAGGYFLLKEGLGLNALLTHPLWLALGFFATALLLLFGRQRAIHPHAVVLIALAQVGAMLPGISRFAATTVVGMLVGLSPRRAMQWSWFIFMPLMFAASIIHGVGGCIIKQGAWLLLQPGMVLACVLAAVISYGCLALVQRAFVTGRAWLLGSYLLLPFLVALVLGLVGG